MKFGESHLDCLVPKFKSGWVVLLFGSDRLTGLQACLLVSLLFLGACASETKTVIYSSASSEAVIAQPEEKAPVSAVSNSVRRAMILADILYEAKTAYDDNRLLSPSGNNAYDRYIEVLSLDPDNAVALEGIQEIVLRYIDLADAARRNYQFEEAESLLARAASINPQHPELVAARVRIEEGRDKKIDTFLLDVDGIKNQSLSVMTELADIAMHIVLIEGTFMINARTDAEGRWIYKVMREAVGGQRLRGNIDISDTPAILVTVPQNSANNGS